MMKYMNVTFGDTSREALRACVLDAPLMVPNEHEEGMSPAGKVSDLISNGLELIGLNKNIAADHIIRVFFDIIHMGVSIEPDLNGCVITVNTEERLFRHYLDRMMTKKVLGKGGYHTHYDAHDLLWCTARHSKADVLMAAINALRVCPNLTVTLQ